MMPEFSYVRVGSTDEAVEHLAGRRARLHAGGTDLLGCLRDRVFEVDKVVSLAALSELEGISETADGGVRIGALTTIARVASEPLIRDRYPGLSQAAGEVASPQLRNQGTLGGNLCQRPRCWYFRGEFECLRKGGGECFAVEGENRFHAIFGGDPCYIVHPSDTAPMLMALGASVRIVGPDGSRTLALEEFFVLPEDDLERENTLAAGEIVTEVTLPPATAGAVSSYRKARERGAWDFALASVATVLRLSGAQVDECSLVLGGVAPAPWRARAAERALLGRELATESIRAAAQAAVADAEPLFQNGYKVKLVEGLMRQSLQAFA